MSGITIIAIVTIIVVSKYFLVFSAEMNYLGLKARGISDGITLVAHDGVVCIQGVLDS